MKELHPTNVQKMFELTAARSIPYWRHAYQDAGDLLLNLGPGNKHITGTIELEYPDWDAETDDIPYPDESVMVIYAMHFLEHLSDPRRMLRECQRVLCSGGLLNIGVPYYSSQLQAQDLDHKAQFCEETWRNLFDNPYYSKDREGWQFTVGANVIMGISERNLMLITQLIKQ